MNPVRRYLLSLHMAVFLFGLAGLFGKIVSLPAYSIVLGRVGFASLFLASLLLIGRRPMTLHVRSDRVLVFLAGTVLTIHWTTFFLSIQISTVAIGLLTFSTFPVFVTFMAPYFFDERLQGGDVLAAVVVVVGVALIIPRFELADRIVQGALWGMVSGFTFALLTIFNRKLAARNSSMVIALYQDLVATVLLLPFIWVHDGPWTMKNLVALVFLGVVCTGVAHTLFIWSMKRVRAQTASIVACLEPLYGILIAAILLGEIPGFRVLIGGAVILGACTYASIKLASSGTTKCGSSGVVE